MNYFSGWKKLQAKLLVVFCHSFLLPSILHVHSPLFSTLYPVPFSPSDISFAATFLERIPPLHLWPLSGWVMDRKLVTNDTLLEVSEFSWTLWKISLVIQIKNHKMSLPFDSILPFQEIIQNVGKAICLKIFQCVIIGKKQTNKRRKTALITKIAK